MRTVCCDVREPAGRTRPSVGSQAVVEASERAHRSHCIGIEFLKAQCKCSCERAYRLNFVQTLGASDAIAFDERTFCIIMVGPLVGRLVGQLLGLVTKGVAARAPAWFLVGQGLGDRRGATSRLLSISSQMCDTWVPAQHVCTMASRADIVAVATMSLWQLRVRASARALGVGPKTSTPLPLVHATRLSAI